MSHTHPTKPNQTALQQSNDFQSMSSDDRLMAKRRSRQHWRAARLTTISPRPPPMPTPRAPSPSTLTSASPASQPRVRHYKHAHQRFAGITTNAIATRSAFQIPTAREPWLTCRLPADRQQHSAGLRIPVAASTLQFVQRHLSCLLVRRHQRNGYSPPQARLRLEI